MPLPALVSRINARVEHYAGRYPALDLAKHYVWKSDRVAEGTYRGGSGLIILSDDRVRVELELPFFARVYKARIEEFVERELGALTVSL